jgi:hypothetical protein
MSQLDELLSRSRSPGRFVERRAFTLSRARAIEKQRAFALRLPQQYILELIQAAVFAGATYIAVDTRPDSLLVAWVGAPSLEPRQLHDLLDHLFADRTRADIKHLVQLAVAVNALLQLEPKLVRIESGDGVRSVRMDVDRAGEGSVGEVEDPIGGTYLLVQFSLGLFGRWRTRRHIDEQQLVEERCLYTPVPILLNGSAPFGYRGSRHIEIFGARRQQHFDEEDRRGVVALHTNPNAPTGFRIVIGGVWIATLPLTELAPRPLLGVVCDDGLRKTADHADIVLDHRYVALLHATQPHATALMRQIGPGTYTAPELPPIPRAEADDMPRAESTAAEPLPDRLPMLGARGSITVGALGGATGPVFHAPPDRAPDLARSGDPVRFPWRLLLLTDGQATTLRAELPHLALHRAASASDLDFVRRMADQRADVRAVDVELPGRGVATLRLHLDGQPPDWADAHEGLPFAIVRGERTVQLGVLVGDRKVLADTPIAPPPLEVGATLPHCSLVLRVPEAAARSLEAAPHLLLDSDVVERVLHAAWRLAAPEDGPAHGPLLLALLGQLGRPTFAAEGVYLHLPTGWPTDLVERPVLPTADGPTPVTALLATPGSDRTVRLASGADLATLELLEERIGFGHVLHTRLDREVVCGVVLVGRRWIEFTDRALADLPVQGALVVCATLAPSPPAGWSLATQPVPGVAGWAPDGAQGVDWADGEIALLELLGRGDDPSGDRGPVTPARAEDRRRLARLQLAHRLGRTEQVVLATSDGERATLADFGFFDRVVARGGALVEGDPVVCLTADERAAIDPARTRTAVHDDPPERWASLDAGGPGWLVRHRVVGDLQGWLGLSVPFDPTASVLLRSTVELVSLPGVQAHAPCHGLVVPGDGASATSHLLLRLDGLHLYQRLAARLADGTFEAEEREAAEAWAFAFAARSWSRRGALAGLAEQLARHVPISGAGGLQWGTALDWFTTPPEERPPLPDGWRSPTPVALSLPAIREPTRWFVERLDAAFPGVAVTVHWADRDGRTPVRLVPERSHRGSVTLVIDTKHPLVRAARIERGAAHEVLLLEAARVAVRHNRWLGRADRLLGAQQALLASRSE